VGLDFLDGGNDESWFHADKEALQEFYGSSFRKNALKASPKVEEIPKSDLEKGLKEATKLTKKGDYFDNKTSHGVRLLSTISPDKVRGAAPNCERLFAAVLKRLK
jgi:predicted Zn-dependent protease